MSAAGPIRPATPADADAIWPLVKDFAVSFTPSRESFDRALASVLGDHDTLVVLADLDGAVVGYLLAERHQTFFAGRPVVWVQEVMVDRHRRGRGLGRALLHAAEAWAIDSDAAYVALATRRAGGFYTALDYEESATFFRKIT